ncbi:DUF7669 domain-containing protein [Aeromicrobium sp. CF3.5]|uniref:DUF7669 domain-containing protein n=1 Tax=Aeromicrobium sp. CF3.5 TaxID=3373078 RepID=UPI003EE55545
MKYDRPVWQLMHACADAMPEVFRYDDVRAWFARNFPEVGDATLRAHVVGLTEGGTKHSQFRRRSPIFRRVARGEYAPIPLAERGESPDDDDDDPPAPSAVRFQAAGSTPTGTAVEPAEPPATGPARTSKGRATEANVTADSARERGEPLAGPRAAADFWPYPLGATETVDGDRDPERLSDEPPARSLPSAHGRDAPAESESEGDLPSPEQPTEIDPDRQEFDRAERNRLAFEATAQQHRERDDAEREQLEREERQLRRTLHPLWDAPRGQERVAPDHETGEDEQPDPPDSPGGIVIVRAPQRADGPRATPADASEERDAGSTTWSRGRDLGEAEAADAIVLGSLGILDDRLGVPAPARDAFRDLDFRRSRRAAEVSGARWFVLSADHGLLEPTDWMSPEDTFDVSSQPRHRAAWATWVVARLEALVGTLEDLVIQVEAPDEMGLPVISALLDAGAAATTGPVRALAPAVSSAFGSAVEDASAAPDATGPGPDHRFAAARSVAEYLGDVHHASDAATLPDRPGLYAWSVDHDGARVLNRALMLPVRAGVIFVGRVGAGEAGFSLGDQLVRVQLHGRARSSTFKMTLATTLAAPLALRSMDDPDLLQWMLQHLSVTVWPTEDVDELTELTSSVIGVLRPPLNLDHVGAREYRRRLAELSARRS